MNKELEGRKQLYIYNKGYAILKGERAREGGGKERKRNSSNY